MAHRLFEPAICLAGRRDPSGQRAPSGPRVRAARRAESGRGARCQTRCGRPGPARATVVPIMAPAAITLGPGGVAVLAAAGLVAGAVNTVVGSGSLLTFPTLLALGYPALTANVTNTIGLVPGSLSGSIGYRQELAGQRGRLLALSIPAALGGLTGAVLLLVLPAGVFRAVVPVLILVACALVAVGPRLSAWLARRDAGRGRDRREGGWGLRIGLFAASVYGGYFGAAVGVLLIGLLALLLTETLQRVNAAKNVLTALTNAVASVLFIAVAPVAWVPVVVLAVSSTIGGQIGARFGRRLSPRALRATVIVVGLVVSVQLLS